MLSLRGQVYRQDLGHLTDEAWLYAVSVARRREWFPSIDELLEFAADAPRRDNHGLPAAGETTLSPKERHAAAIAGLEAIRAELQARGVPMGETGEAVKVMPAQAGEEA